MGKRFVESKLPWWVKQRYERYYGPDGWRYYRSVLEAHDDACRYAGLRPRGDESVRDKGRRAQREAGNG